MLHRNIDDRAAESIDRVDGAARSGRHAPPLLTPCSNCVTLVYRVAKSRRDTRARPRGEDIVVDVNSIIIMLIVGAIAGWLAGQIVRGFGFGLLWNIILGIVGAFIGVWLLRQLGFMPFSGFIGSIVNAVIGAVVLLVIVGFIRR
jgi:uncharacterized membrane protein YeaQ/YmgE (transglycosylase-associated protein family)